MILTQPALDILKQRFSVSSSKSTKPRLFDRPRVTAKPFTSQAYAEQGLAPAGERAGSAISSSMNNPQRRKALL